ncbi:MAG TPA: aldo/keto reductase [bacterium]|nr:aldo/keto reductase [bacterium]
MQRRTLGKSGLEASPLCFGGNVFGWTADEPTSFKMLDAFMAAGMNFIDTADVYAKWAPGNQGGESETLLGRWMKQRGNRDKVIIATKVGSDMGPQGKGLSRVYIMRAVDASLKRLQTHYVDLYQSHIDDPGTALEETLGAYADLIAQGKVRTIGASNYTAERLTEALQVSKKHAFPRYESLQPLYNLYDRTGYETALEPLCRTEGVGVISYSSLGSGFLSGKYRSEGDVSKSVRGQGVQRRYYNDRGFRILRALDEVAQQHRSTPGAVALAWLLGRPGLTAPIVSATSVEQLNELMAVTRLELDAASIEHLTQASA